MVFIPGVSNGQSGFGMHRALFPSNMGGPFGERGNPLPNAFANPTATVSNSRNYGKHRSRSGSRSRRNKKSRKTNKKSRKTKKSKKH